MTHHMNGFGTNYVKHFSPVNYRHVEGGWTADIDGRCPACMGTCKAAPIPLEDLQRVIRKLYPRRGELYYPLRRQK